MEVVERWHLRWTRDSALAELPMLECYLAEEASTRFSSSRESR